MEETALVTMLPPLRHILHHKNHCLRQIVLLLLKSFGPHCPMQTPSRIYGCQRWDCSQWRPLRKSALLGLHRNGRSSSGRCGWLVGSTNRLPWASNSNVQVNSGASRSQVLLYKLAEKWAELTSQCCCRAKMVFGGRACLPIENEKSTTPKSAKSYPMTYFCGPSTSLTEPPSLPKICTLSP